MGVCVWARVSAAPCHSWRVLVWALRLHPATPGLAARRGCVCLGSGFGCFLWCAVVRCWLWWPVVAGASLWRSAVRFSLLVVLVCVFSMFVRCCVALRVVLFGSG